MKAKLRKAFAMMLTANMLMSLLSVSAFAAETEYVEINDDGTVTTTVTTEAAPETDENGNVTVVVTIEETTTDENDQVISAKETTTTITTTPESGDEAAQTVVSVPMVSGEAKMDEADREVTAEVDEVTVTEGENNGDLVSTNPTVAPEEYEGKQEVRDEVYPGSDDPDKDLFQGGGLSYANGWDMATGWLGIIKEEIDEHGNSKWVFDPENLQYAAGPSIEGEAPEYVLLAAGESSNSKIAIKEVEYEVDENGNVKKDEEGNPIYKLSSKTNNQYVAQMVLWGTDGKPYYAYSVASEEEAQVSTLVSGYTAEELSKSEQFKDDEDAQEHIRGIALHGYWGASNEQDENGDYKTGSLNKIKAEMAAAVENGLVLEVNGSTDKEMVLDAIANLTEGDALTATQAALWAYSRGTEADVDGELGSVVTGNFTNDANGYVSMIYQYLLGVTEQDPELISVDKNSMNLVIGDKAGEKSVETVENGESSVAETDIYHAALNFSLTIVPGDKDELNVILTYTGVDGKEQTVIKALGQENNDTTIAPNEDGSYTIGGLKLSENEDLKFDLKLEGIQHLENGVYIYSATNENDMDYEEVGEVGAAFSTLLGVGEAGRTVDVTTSVTLTFSVEEDEDDPADDDTSSASGSDASAPDDSGNDNSGDDDGEEDITDIIIDEEIPLSGFAVVELPLADVSDTESDVEEDVLFEDDIPLADVPKTGDASALWMVLSAVSGAGLFLLNKKREDN